MKKSTILSFTTVAAITATTFGSYAAWDSLTSKKETTLNIAKSTVVNTSELTLTEVSSDRSTDDITYEGDLTVNITDMDSYNPTALTFAPIASIGETPISGGTLQILESDTVLVDNRDSSISNNNEYKVRFTANKSLAGQQVKIVVSVAATK